MRLEGGRSVVDDVVRPPASNVDLTRFAGVVRGRRWRRSAGAGLVLIAGTGENDGDVRRQEVEWVV
ncbi:hypothetical protein GCM10009634_13160 [Saccharothrix xinjiangensis]